ncbi:hypothetical protein BDQ12DRAFT_684928 [Crucibulum laeve]|uniref:Uncharacterized protein n=1 Tax=Crucibulum laeve TaxID=68775 RepID=A0A5C3LYE5_9AGAR|nr:hypothetical protein BDQ12DRAFT_684928 [Crucibulum laeve]
MVGCRARAEESLCTACVIKRSAPPIMYTQFQPSLHLNPTRIRQIRILLSLLFVLKSTAAQVCGVKQSRQPTM